MVGELTQRNLTEAGQRIEEDRARLQDLSRRITEFTGDVADADAEIIAAAQRITDCERQVNLHGSEANRPTKR